MLQNKQIENKKFNINYVNVNESFLPTLRNTQIIRLDDEPYSKFDEVKQKLPVKKYLNSFFGLALLAIGSYFGMDWWQNRPFEEKVLNEIKFEVIKTVGKYPQAVRFRYDISALPNVKSIEVETGVGTIISTTNFIADYLNANKIVDTLSQTYFYPGIYKVDLIVNKKVVKTINHIVYSKPNIWTAWGFGVAFEKDWITNISTTKNYIKNGVFHFDPTELPKEIKNEDDLKNTTHVLTQDFGVGLDSLQIETRMKNPESEGGESCYDMQLNLFDKNFNIIGAKFTMVGCTDYASLIAGKTYFRIQNNKKKNIDLDNFGVDQNQWNVFKLNTKGKVLEVFVNDKLAFKRAFETNEALTNLVDTRFTFKGAGSIDWVKISNSFTGKLVYSSDFDN